MAKRGSRFGGQMDSNCILWIIGIAVVLYFLCKNNSTSTFGKNTVPADRVPENTFNAKIKNNSGNTIRVAVNTKGQTSNEQISKGGNRYIQNITTDKLSNTVLVIADMVTNKAIFFQRFDNKDNNNIIYTSPTDITINGKQVYDLSNLVKVVSVKSIEEIKKKINLKM
jgi:hypothetical protein